jgi:hypothetical protein
MTHALPSRVSPFSTPFRENFRQPSSCCHSARPQQQRLGTSNLAPPPLPSLAAYAHPPLSLPLGFIPVSTPTPRTPGAYPRAVGLVPLHISRLCAIERPLPPLLLEVLGRFLALPSRNFSHFQPWSCPEFPNHGRFHKLGALLSPTTTHGFHPP